MSCRSTPRPADLASPPPDRTARCGGIDDVRPEAPPAARRADSSDPDPVRDDEGLAARLPRARTQVAELTFLDYRLAAAHAPALAGLDLARFYDLGAARHEEAASRLIAERDGDSRTAWARARNVDLAARLRACAAEARADVEAEAELRRRRAEPA